jgi:hypothetical protein
MQKINFNLLKYKNPTTGGFENLHAFVGKSAYDFAKEGGFSGTEQEFSALLASIATLEARIAELEAAALTTASDDGEGNVTIG